MKDMRRYHFGIALHHYEENMNQGLCIAGSAIWWV